MATVRLQLRIVGKNAVYHLGYVESMYRPVVDERLTVAYPNYVLKATVSSVEHTCYIRGHKAGYDAPIVEVELWDVIDIRKFLVFWQEQSEKKGKGHAD